MAPVLGGVATVQLPRIMGGDCSQTKTPRMTGLGDMQ